MKKTYHELVFNKNSEKTLKKGTDESLMSPNKIKETLDRAWQIRDFEIDLYWKRTLYFAGFISVIFVGFFSKDMENNHLYSVLIALAGFILSWFWSLANEGSKFWQKNWEKHIDFLEEEYGTNLYKTVLFEEKPSYSVSKINLALSQFITLMWFFLFIYSVIRTVNSFHFSFQFTEKDASLIVLFCVFFAVLIIGAYKVVQSCIKSLKTDDSNAHIGSLEDSNYKFMQRKK